MFLLLLVAVIPTLALSGDLQAMLSFTSDWNPKDPSWTPLTAVCSWSGVVCDSNNTVYQFGWQNGTKGTVNMTFLPSGMQALDLSYNQFTGTPNLDSLPSGIQQLDLSNNQFTGTPNLASLPSGMQELHLSNNQFCGATLTNIPCSHITFPAKTTCTPVVQPSNTSAVIFPPCGGKRE